MSLPKTIRRRRGQATVEMAVLMVALIPTFLYVLTSDDLLRYRLNLQEVVVSSPWNYTHLNYEKGHVEGNALVNDLRRRYRNVNNTYSMHYNNVPTEERTAPMTFSDWNVAGSANQNQVNCNRENPIAAETTLRTEPSANSLAGYVESGGLYSCSAALSVRNVQLVNRFLQDWSGEDVTDKAQGSGAWGLNRQYFSVMTGTWAMTTVEDVEPTGGDKEKALNKRVQSVYEGAPGYTTAYSRAVGFVQGGQEVLNMGNLLQDSGKSGDDPRTAEVGFSKENSPHVSSPGDNKIFDASPWSRQGAAGRTYEDAYNARQKTYMGRNLD